MTKQLALIALATFTIGGNCGGNAGGDGDAAQAVSLSCYVADMWRCDEEPLATAAQRMNAPVSCSSLSGVFHSPAACPTADFQGRCTLPPASTGMDGMQIQRFYTGADVTYASDYCVNTAHGTWSTTF